MRTWMVGLVVLLLAVTATAGDWKIGMMGNDRMLGIRALDEIVPTIHVGVELRALENANGINKQSYSLAAVGAWDIVPLYNYPLKGMFLDLIPLPETVPVGLKLGASLGGELDVEGRARYGMADVWAELTVNPLSRAPMGVQLRHEFGPDLWKGLPTLPEATSVMLVVMIGLPK